MSEQPVAGSGTETFVYGGSADVSVPKRNGAAPGSMLDRIRAVTLDTLKSQTKTFPIPVREGFEVAYSTYLPRERLDVYRQAHQDDLRGYERAILIAQCRRILVDGEPWLGNDQQPVTFTSTDMWEALGAGDAFDALDALYLRDPDVSRTANSVLAAAGWDLSQPLDPTQP